MMITLWYFSDYVQSKSHNPPQKFNCMLQIWVLGHQAQGQLG